MPPEAPHSPDKLAGTQWTAVNPVSRRRHWEVVGLTGDAKHARMRAVIDGHLKEIPWRTLRDRTQWVPGWRQSSDEESPMPSILCFDTPASASPWITVDDVVMGGRSDSHVRWLPEDQQGGILRFEGEVSLENNGGFCSTRNQGQWDLSGMTELIWTVRGTERTFTATIRDGDTPEGASFRHPLRPTPDEWQQLSLSLDDFRLFRRGKALSEKARVDPAHIRSFGFLLADKQAGPFHLDLRELRAC